MQDAEEAYLWWRQYSPVRADQWFNGLAAAIESLAEHPGRCPLIPENEELEVEIRQLLYGSRPTSTYRILFRIRKEAVVRVLRIRHSARDRIRNDEFEEADLES